MLKQLGSLVAAAALSIGAASAADFGTPYTSAPLAVPTSSGWVTTIKGNITAGPKYPGADDYSIMGFPSVSFSRVGTPRRFSAPDDGLSFSVLDETSLRFGLVGRFQGGRYLADNRELFGLAKVPWAVEAGAFVEFWPVEFLRARAELRHGFNGHHGFVGDVGLDLVQNVGAFTLSVGPRMALGDSDFTETYFGVSPYEAVLNGRVTPYAAAGGITSVGALAGISYDWSPQWSTTAYVRYSRLVGDAADSPIVKQFGSENQIKAGVTVSYSFDSGFGLPW
jgi:outer membrane scaffolding protein for murein synthesis (MipA/OmpV family)